MYNITCARYTVCNRSYRDCNYYVVSTIYNGWVHTVVNKLKPSLGTYYSIEGLTNSDDTAQTMIYLTLIRNVNFFSELKLGRVEKISNVTTKTK